MWYYLENNAQQGPVEESAIDGLIRNGEITRQTAVWKEGMPDWTNIMETELGPRLSQAAPPVQPPAEAEQALAVTQQPVAGAQRPAAADRVKKLDNLFMAYWICLAAGIPLCFVAYVGTAGVIAAIVLASLLLYEFWSLIQDGNARTTPGTAVGYCFIPGFNFYWIFQAYWGLAKDMVQYMGERGVQGPRPNKDLALTYCILSCCVVVPCVNVLTGIAGLVISIIIMKQFKDAAAAIIRHEAAA